MPEWKDAERAAYLALALVPGIGAARFRALVDRFESPGGALAAPLALLGAVRGMSTAAATAVREADVAAAGAAIRRAEELGGHLLLPGDRDFPGGIAEIPEPPTCLFALGNLDLFRKPAVAIVGSRDHSAYGAEVCRAVASAAAGSGLVVVSGMARGLDAVAHAGALDVSGGTIGVLGNGLGVIYPAANRALYARAEAQGLLITEFPPGERPRTGSFPRRNRLISGLARVTVVIEAAIASGALQTVACALEQGRDVMAVPGPVTSSVSEGTNRLIRDGAAPLLELDDLLAFYPELAPRAGSEAIRIPADPLQRRILDILHRGPRRVEELMELSEAPVGRALDALSVLELAGQVRQGEGGLYCAVHAALFA